MGLLAHRIAGLGSLGRERYLAIADFRGGSVAREAKALAPSACLWAEREKGTAPILYQEIMDRAVRSRDPFVRFERRWIVRRLAPDCSRIELSALPRERDELRLLHAMGAETANIHLGTATTRTLIADLRQRPRAQLASSVRRQNAKSRSGGFRGIPAELNAEIWIPLFRRSPASDSIGRLEKRLPHPAAQPQPKDHHVFHRGGAEERRKGRDEQRNCFPHSRRIAAIGRSRERRARRKPCAD